MLSPELLCSAWTGWPRKREPHLHRALQTTNKRASDNGWTRIVTRWQTGIRAESSKVSESLTQNQSVARLLFRTNHPCCLVPALPIRKDNIRQRVPETPTHTGGLPSAAREALAARLKSRNMPTNLAVGGTLALSADTREMRDNRPGDKGLGEFARRGNRGLNREERNYDRDRDRRDDRNDYRGGRRDDRDRRDPGRPKDWNDAPTPRTNRTDGRDLDGGSMRVPNRGWDETPRIGGRGGATPGRGPNRAWDAPTPRRNARGGDASPDGDGMEFDAKEWEEEQVRLDRDWYSTYDEGAVVSLREDVRSCCRSAKSDSRSGRRRGA
jgi:hypothetical protein